MLLDKIFIQLKGAGPWRRFWVSRLYTAMGRTFIGTPQFEDLPEDVQKDAKTARAALSCYFDHPTDRLMVLSDHVARGGSKWNWIYCQHFLSMIRKREEVWVSLAAGVVPTVVGGLLIGLALTMGLSSEQRAERQAKHQAAEAADYVKRSADLKAEWTKDAEGYSAGQCEKAMNGLRDRSAREDADHYAVLESACSAKVDEQAKVYATYDLDRCVKESAKVKAVADPKGVGDATRITPFDRTLIQTCFATHGKAFQSAYEKR
jgi:hypothetical protein